MSTSSPDWIIRAIGRIRGSSWREKWLFQTLLTAAAEEFFALWLCRNREADYEIVAWSSGAERLYGFSKEYALGKSYIRLIVSEPERAEALVTTEQTIQDGTTWPNYLNRDEREDGSLVLTLTQNIRVWNPFDREYQFAEVGLDVSDLFESEHALLERRNEDRLSVNEMTRLSLLGKSLALTKNVRSLNDVSRLVADRLSSTLLEAGSVAVWLVHINEQQPRLLARSGDIAIPLPTDLIYSRGVHPRTGGASVEIGAIASDQAPGAFILATTSLSIAQNDSIVISVIVKERPQTERSKVFLESSIEACASAIHQWLIHSEHWSGDQGHTTLALVEAELVANELSHIAKNRLTTIQNIVFLLRAWSADKPFEEDLASYLSQLEAEVAQAAAQLLHAQGGLSSGNALLADIAVQAIEHSVPAMRSIVNVVIEPIDLQLKGPSFNFDTVISNLIRNAVDSVLAAGVPEPKVIVHIAEMSNSGRRSCEVEVHDNGPGVSAEIELDIFSGTSTKGAGHGGQGLRNVLRAVSAVGGKIELPERSPLLGGAVFRVVYPLEM